MPAECYCGTALGMTPTLVCQVCKRIVHLDCLKKGKPSPLEGDIFFTLTCADCAEGSEEFLRIKLQWLPVVMLTLFNLQLSGTGKRGYYRWKEHICSFIDRYWQLFFGPSRKKTQTWHGTVAGTLSSGCPIYFSSGTTELGESGWWRLTHNQPPPLSILSASKCGKKVRPDATKETIGPLRMEGLRTRGKKTSIEAAIELKAKRDTLQESKDMKRDREDAADILADCTFIQTSEGTSLSSPTSVLSMQGSSFAPSEDSQHSVVHAKEDLDCSHSTCSSTVVPFAADITDQSSQMSVSSCRSRSSDQWLTERDLMAGEKVPEMLLMAEDEEDYDIDPCAISPPPFISQEKAQPDMIERLLSSYPSDPSKAFADEAPAPIVAKDDENARMSFDQSDSGDFVANEAVEVKTEAESAESEGEEEVEEIERPRKRKRVESVTRDPLTKIVPMNRHSEAQLLRQLSSFTNLTNAAARRLRRKLIVRKVKRERSLLTFDPNQHQLLGSQSASRSCMLDKFKALRGTSSSFLCKLIGSSVDELKPIQSPYTSRILKPFIRRDYENCPPKMKLLSEIVSHVNKNNPLWVQPSPHPIDYCYVRPQHIPSVNALCHHFFWPDIDLSECLQYPDFSCVALYRRLVIGFAFMVPDAKYNEAYISFLFTHPEWRRAGIATFMLYHLIQTCMGKDVTLHVSASNPAMLLYQKFGFKPEEFCHNFYEKYFPEESTECRHAFLLRLQR